MPFQLMVLHDPFGLLATHLAIVFQYIQPTCRDCSLHVPRRLRKVRDSNPRAISDSRVSGAVLSASQPTFLLLLQQVFTSSSPSTSETSQMQSPH